MKLYNCIIFLIILLTLCFAYYSTYDDPQTLTVSNAIYNNKIIKENIIINQNTELLTMEKIFLNTNYICKTIVISAAGDVTLGQDENFSYYNSFNHEYINQNYDYTYFFKNVRKVFENDDLTIVNLETTLTDAVRKRNKKYKFKGNPTYAKILSSSKVEVVNIANNHINDYFDKGYNDTLKNLSKYKIDSFGYKNICIKEVKGIKIGLLGYEGWNNSLSFKNKLKENLIGLKNETDLIIVSFHWGIERSHYPNSIQKDLAHFCIDNGADLILGHHPHVLQGIEKYKGKTIVYSLGNFCFGGNKNPQDKDTIIYQHRFVFEYGILKSEESNIIPCSISSVDYRNNYQPTILKGNKAKQVLKRVKIYSEAINSR